MKIEGEEEKLLQRMERRLIRRSSDTADILRRRGLGDSNKARIMLASEVARKCGPYVPKQSGVLKNSSQIAE